MNLNLRNALSNAFVGSGGGADATKLPLTGGTLTGTLVLSGSANTSILTSTGFSNTGSDVTNMISLAGTWNTSGTTPTAIKLDMTHTSATDPRWVQFSRSGTATLWAGIASSLLGNTNAPVLQGGTNGTQAVLLLNNNCVYAMRADTGWGLASTYNFTALPNNSIIGFTGSAGFSSNVPTAASQVTSFFAYGGAAAAIQMGANHATTATDQTFKAHDVTNGTAGKMTIAGGNATTSGTGGGVEIKGGTGATASGLVLIKDIPTSNPGAGYLWNNAGTLEIGT